MRRPRRRQRRPSTLARSLVLLAGTALGAGLYLLLGDAGRASRQAAPLAVQLDELAAMAGLRLDQIEVSGHRFTSDSDVFAALRLDDARSVFGLDPAAAERRLLSLPRVKTATVVRQPPSTLIVQITERAPFAVWRRPGREVLIDVEGRELAPVAPGLVHDLPVVSGEGAARDAAVMIDALERYPDIARRTRELERVADRRWTLHLDSGGAVHLPAGETGAALARLAALRLAGSAYEVIDLRVAGEIVLRGGAASASGSPLVQQ